MADLERDLRTLAAAVEWPATPQLGLRLEPRRARLRLAWVAVAALVVALAVAFSVPAARSAILRIFHLGGVTVERVDTLPRARRQPLAAGLGRVVTERAAARALGTTARLPVLARSAELHLKDGVVSVVVPGPKPLLLSELRSNVFYLKKIAGAATGVRWVRVGRTEGIWIAGAPHVVLRPPAPARLAGNVLVWQIGTITYRLEGRGLTLARALRLAGQINGT
jgi:hypothetical protein